MSVVMPASAVLPPAFYFVSWAASESNRRFNSGEAQPLQAGAASMVWFLYLMNFEFDRAKSSANLEKHGIDFVRAQALWSHPDQLELPARSLDDTRTQVIGRIGDVLWSAFITMRGDRIRIISIRRARDEEKASYLQD